MKSVPGSAPSLLVIADVLAINMTSQIKVDSGPLILVWPELKVYFNNAHVGHIMISLWRVTYIHQRELRLLHGKRQNQVFSMKRGIPWENVLQILYKHKKNQHKISIYESMNDKWSSHVLFQFMNTAHHKSLLHMDTIIIIPPDNTRYHYFTKSIKILKVSNILRR